VLSVARCGPWEVFPVSPLRVDFVEYDGSTTTLRQFVGEALVFAFTFALILLIVGMAS
jgi:hypothetical protein